MPAGQHRARRRLRRRAPWLALAASTALPMLLPPAAAGFTAQASNPGSSWTAAVVAPPTNLAVTASCAGGTATAKLTWLPPTGMTWASGYRLTGSDGVAQTVAGYLTASATDSTPLVNGTSYTWQLVTYWGGWTSTAATAALTANCPPATVSGSAVPAPTVSGGVYTFTPAGVAVGDLMVVQIALTSTTNDFTGGVPPGWTSAGTVVGSGMKSFVYYRVATTADTEPTASYTWQTASSGASANGTGAMVAFRGVDPASPLDGPAKSASGTASTTNPTATAPGVPTTHTNDLLVVLFAAFTAQVSSAGTMTQSYNFPPTSSAGPVVGLAGYTDTVKDLTADTGPRTATLSGKPGAWTAWTLALAP